MGKYYFLIDEKNGEYKEIALDDIKEKDQKQILAVEGMDSEFITQLVVEYANGERRVSGNYLISKFSNYEGLLELDITVGNYSIISIKRRLPKIEFEIEYKNNLTREFEIGVYNSFHEGFKNIASKK